MNQLLSRIKSDIQLQIKGNIDIKPLQELQNAINSVKQCKAEQTNQSIWLSYSQNNKANQPNLSINQTIANQMTEQRRRHIQELIRLHVKTGIDLLTAINQPKQQNLDEDISKLVDEFTEEQLSVPKIEESQIELESSVSDWRQSVEQIADHLIAEEDEDVILKKKYQILTNEQLKELAQDLEAGRYTREQLVNKYRISMTTLARYVRLYKSKRQSRGSEEGKITHKQARNVRQHVSIRSQKENQLKLQSAGRNRKHSAVGQSLRCLAQTNSPTNIHYRFLFMRELNKLDQQKLIFLDELRYLKKVDSPKSNTTISDPAFGFLEEINFVVALGNYHVLDWKLKHSRINESEFISFLLQVSRQYSDFTILMDNSSLHKGKLVKSAISTNRIKVLYLPPRSPQLNPIAMFYEHFKYRLAPMLFPEYSPKRMSAQTNKVFKQIEQDGLRNPFFSRNLQYRTLSQKKQPFP